MSLDPATKKAMVVSFANMSKDQIAKQDVCPVPFDPARCSGQTGRQSQPLGEKEIDGRRVVGFRIKTEGAERVCGAIPKTGLPVRIEVTMAMYPGVKTTMSDFVFNVPMDESLFSVDPPAGYTIERQKSMFPRMRRKT